MFHPSRADVAEAKRQKRHSAQERRLRGYEDQQRELDTRTWNVFMQMYGHKVDEIKRDITWIEQRYGKGNGHING